jgi:hypothetical protein
MLHFDPTATLQNIRAAETDDLIDRVTAYRAGLEPEAVELITDELRRRDVDPALLDARRRTVETEFLRADNGDALPCSRCHRPAVVRGWRWFRVWGLLPLLPLPAQFCDRHRPDRPGPRDRS